MKHKNLYYRASRLHRMSESQQNEKTQEKEVKNMHMKRDKFNNIASAHEGSEAQAGEEREFHRRWDEPRGKFRRYGQRCVKSRLNRVQRRARLVGMRRKRRPGLPIHLRYNRYQHHRQFTPVAPSFQGLLFEKQRLQKRIRQLKRRLHDLRWQMDRIKEHRKGYDPQNAYPQRP